MRYCDSVESYSNVSSSLNINRTRTYMTSHCSAKGNMTVHVYMSTSYFQFTFYYEAWGGIQILTPETVSTQCAAHGSHSLSHIIQVRE